MRKREQTNKLYSNEVRKEAVRLHEEDKWTYKQITEKYGIQDKDRVRKWCINSGNKANTDYWIIEVAEKSI
ncbi:MAG: hypothetical protein ACE3L7_09195 [Candidatus Pristimantibacillus sp.]